MKKSLIFVLFCAAPLLGQPIADVRSINADPTGSTCSNNTIALLTPSGVLYTCQKGTFQQGANGGYDAATGIAWGGSAPFVNYAAWSFNAGLSYPPTAFVVSARHLNGIRIAVQVPSGSGYNSSVGVPISLYSSHSLANGVAFGGFTSVQARASGQQLYGWQPNVADVNGKNPSDPGVTSYATRIMEAVEADMGTTNTSSCSSLCANYGGGNLPGSAAQGANSYFAYVLKSSSALGTLIANAVKNDMTLDAAATYTGSFPYNYAFQVTGTGTPDTLSYTAFAPGGCTSAGCVTGTDLVIQSTTTNVIPTASHVFTLGDVGGTMSLQILSGTGCTVASYTIASLNATAAVLSGAAGTVGSTCTYVLWNNTGVSLAATVRAPLPADATTTTVLNNAAIRPISTDYGVIVDFASTTGHTLNDNWSFPTTGVPTIHYLMGGASGSVDRGILHPVQNNGVSQPGVRDYYPTFDNLGTTRFGYIWADTATKGVNLSFEFDRAASDSGDGFSFKSNTAGTETTLGVIDSLGNLSVAGNVGGLVSFPFSSSATGITLSAAPSGNCSPSSCMVNSVFIRTGANTAQTDTTDTATAIVGQINVNRSDACFNGYSFPFIYKNGTGNTISLAPGSGVTFSPSGTWTAIPVGNAVTTICRVTSCSSPAIVCNRTQNAPY